MRKGAWLVERGVAGEVRIWLGMVNANVFLNGYFLFRRFRS